MEHALISIIIPAYNIEKYIERTLDSVLRQSYRHLEIIIVDDGSKDATGAIADRYAAADNRIRVIHQQNSGVTCARLNGVRHAAGYWIGFVDGDDVIDPWMYEKLLENAVSKDADISHCGYRMVFPSGNVHSYYGTGKFLVHDNTTGLLELLRGSFIEPALCNKLYARYLFAPILQGELMDTSIKNTEDLLMNFYLFREAHRSVYEDVCPYHYLVRSGSAANASLNIHQLEDPLKVRQIIEAQTASDAQLHAVAAERVIRQLIRLATMSLQNSEVLIRPVRKNARLDLRKRLPGILRNQRFPFKLKIMAIWTAISPGSYCLVHHRYEVMKGLDKIYEK